MLFLCVRALNICFQVHSTLVWIHISTWITLQIRSKWGFLRTHLVWILHSIKQNKHLWIFCLLYCLFIILVNSTATNTWNGIYPLDPLWIRSYFLALSISHSCLYGWMRGAVMKTLSSTIHWILDAYISNSYSKGITTTTATFSTIDTDTETLNLKCDVSN